ncbi:MAG: cytochrome P450 [Hyphomonadaceae bacterium]
MSAGAAIPAHVPQDLVRDFSFWRTPGMAPTPNGDPQAALSFVHQGPRIFYAPNNTVQGHGTWVITRADDQRRVLQDPATFSSDRAVYASTLGENWRLVPFESDPPSHSYYRTLLNPLLSPKRVTAMEAGARERAVRLIETFKDKGECEVMQDFAFPFAVGVFLQFLGLPDSRRPEFLRWADQLLHSTEITERVAAMGTIKKFMEDLVKLRRREPADDFMTYVIQADVDGRPLTDDEATGMGALIFTAGLDTVASAIGFDLRHLAQNPDDQERLRANPALIPSAVEEMFRAFATVQMLRVVTKDTEFEGIQMKAGDWVSCATMIANRDPHEFPEPNRIDLSRENNRHTAFAYGPHRCLGSHLARRELIIGLEEYLARLPPFRIKPGTAPIAHGGFVFSIKDLYLSW